MKRPRLLRAATLALALALTALPAAAASLFENRADAQAFKARVKRDPFDLKRDLPAAAEPAAAAATVEVALPEPAAADVKPVEEFRVEGIIRIGERGCAIINAKTWYVGKTNLGYRLDKLYDDKVEITTPDGRTLTCNLIRERTAGPANGE